MLRARSGAGEAIRASTYQYAPRNLLFHVGPHADGLDVWRAGDIAGRALPEHLRPGWRQLRIGNVRGENEASAVPTACWIAEHGREHGFRAPSVAERTRGLGLEGYMEALRLTELATYNGQGNSFDRGFIGLRIGRPVREWLQGGNLDSHRFPSPDITLGIYRRIRRVVASEGWDTVTTPIPLGILAPAAEDGRGVQ